MRCRLAKEWTLSRRDFTLPPEDERALQNHLSACASCAAYAGEITQLGRLLADLPLAEPSENFDWRLRLALSKAEREAAEWALPAPARARRVWLEFAAAAAVAAVAVLVAGTLWWPTQSSTPQPRAELRLPGSVASAPQHGEGRVIPVSDGGSIGPQLAPSYSYFMQRPATPDVAADSSAGAPGPSGR